MAGGGFYVCGSASLTAPHALIYNTDDTVGGTEVEAIGQVEFFTLGTVSLHPQVTGLYSGLTIFQDHDNVVSTQACDKKNHTQINPALWDIALIAMWNPDGNGSLGGISGTIYANDASSSSPVDDFGDSISGTATLAIITDCILIDGSDSTFNFSTSPGKLFGVTATLSG